ncbi:MAG: hypothetical protein NXY57DRAFT_1034240 [Lentinula lateritia]|nr:MAG: hypothetical protein NXY57DRAFT_1034240 [Lentinula lateritia]
MVIQWFMHLFPVRCFFTVLATTTHYTRCGIHKAGCSQPPIPPNEEQHSNIVVPNFEWEDDSIAKSLSQSGSSGVTKQSKEAE